MRTSNENVRRERHSAQDSRRAFTLISALKSFDTGQPVSAAFTAASNLALSAPGTRATRSRWLFVMVNPSPTFSRLSVAVVSSLSAFKPAPPSCAESAIVKHPACAAARSSSGLVPTPFSKRVLKEYCTCLRTPLSVDIAPFPVLRSPCQTALALRCISSLLVFCISERLVMQNVRFYDRPKRYMTCEAYLAHAGYIEYASAVECPG